MTTIIVIASIVIIGIVLIVIGAKAASRNCYKECQDCYLSVCEEERYWAKDPDEQFRILYTLWEEEYQDKETFEDFITPIIKKHKQDLTAELSMIKQMSLEELQAYKLKVECNAIAINKHQ